MDQEKSGAIHPSQHLCVVAIEKEALRLPLTNLQSVENVVKTIKLFVFKNMSENLLCSFCM